MPRYAMVVIAWAPDAESCKDALDHALVDAHRIRLFEPAYCGRPFHAPMSGAYGTEAIVLSCGDRHYNDRLMPVEGADDDAQRR